MALTLTLTLIGGVFQKLNGYITDKEAAYAIREFEKRNLSHVIAQIFLHDDDADVGGNTRIATEWLRAEAPGYPPQVNTFPDSGPETLYQNRHFVFSPEDGGT